MTTTAIRKKLVDYMQTANDKKVRAIYTMVESDIEMKDTGLDEEFFKELDRRSQSFHNGTAKTYTWKEAKQAARESIQRKSSSKTHSKRK